MSKSIRVSIAQRLLLAGLIACLAAPMACRRANKNANQQSAQGSVAVESEEEKQAKLNPDESYTNLPPEFPKEMPNFPDAKVEKVRKPKGAMREIFFTTQGQYDQIIAFYKDALPKAGYDLTANLRMAARKTWSCDFHKGGQQCSVMIFPHEQDKSKLTIDLIYQMPSTVASLPTLPEEKFDVIGPGAPIAPVAQNKVNAPATQVRDSTTQSKVPTQKGK
jgi:hypothetical protein